MVEQDWATVQLESDGTFFKPTWLYIKQHKITKIKYFGKTTKDDPVSYKGSGTYWLKHLKKHGDNVDTIWTRLFTNKEELISFAVNFSKDNNILNALDPDGNRIWANLMIETGIGPGSHREETKIRIRNNCKGRNVSPETCKKISKSRQSLFTEEKRNNYKLSKQGNKNPAWHGFIITPDGIFDSSIIAAKYYSCSDKTIIKYCKESKFGFKQEKDYLSDMSNITTLNNVEKYKQEHPPTIIIKKCKKYGRQGYIKCPYGIFISSKIAETYCDLNASTIMRRCYSNKFPEWLLLQQLNNNDYVISQKKEQTDV